MRYFHRTPLSPDDVISEADGFFALRLERTGEADRSREFRGSIGTLTVKVEAEGGHYTLITVGTDQVGESEIDKLAKRFLGLIHTRVDAKHQLRGAY